MPLTINILPDFIANQIAAGEVVQRPESVVKELVENSLDAGAETIVVIIRDAGKQLIHVLDNGNGMSREDIELATLRHTTSKIFTSEDLERIGSFGFRGEALSSISSVSHLEIRTNDSDETLGWKLIAEPSKELLIEPVNMDKGTQIFVRNLFYNVPARRKFLRSNLTEFRHISDIMVKFALSNPDKRVTFYDGDTLIFDVNPSGIEQRIREILGKSTAESMIPFNYENESLKISGFIGEPHIAKNSRSGQYMFLNGRSIQNRSLSHAVYTSFEHLIEKKKHPRFIINIELDYDRVDVNVHPQKHEVKFEDERFIYNSVQKAVSQALQQNNFLPEIHLREQVSASPFETIHKDSSKDSNDMILINKETGEVIEKFTPPDRGVGTKKFVSNDSLEYTRNRTPEAEEISAFEAIFNDNRSPDNKNKNEESQDNINSESDLNASGIDFNTLQMHLKYIFMPTDTGYLIIDQHRAHSKIIYESVLKRLKDGFVNSQDMLFPVQIEFGITKINVIEKIKNELVKLGYNFSLSGNSVELTAVPSDVKSGNEEKIFKEIIEDFESKGEIKKEIVHESLACSFSEKVSFKKGDRLTTEEVTSLVNKLFSCESPEKSPLGKLVFVEKTLQELLLEFK